MLSSGSEIWSNVLQVVCVSAFIIEILWWYYGITIWPSGLKTNPCCLPSDHFRLSQNYHKEMLCFWLVVQVYKRWEGKARTAAIIRWGNNGLSNDASAYADLEQLEYFLVVTTALVLLDNTELCGLLVSYRPVELQASDNCSKTYTHAQWEYTHDTIGIKFILSGCCI